MLDTLRSPLFILGVLLFAAIEAVWRIRSGHGYDFRAAAGTLGVALGDAVVSALLGALIIGTAYFAVWQAAPVRWPVDDWRTWVAGFVLVEFAYYWMHRWSLTIRWMWATHAVHHSPNELTLLAAVRLGWTKAFSGGWIVFLPLVLGGFHPLVVATLLALNLKYQFLLHTEAVGRLGPLEWVFNTPSHHRVHHASNPAYIDRNFGGVVIVFDRLFGTFAQERQEEPCRYGLTKPLVSNNPAVIALREWGWMLRDAWRAGGVLPAVRVLFGRPR